MRTTTKMYLFRFFRSLTFFGAVSVPFFIDWIQISYTQMFLLQAWFMISIFVLEIPTGIIADKYGRRASLILASVATVFSMLLFGLLQNYYLLFLAETLGALGAALFSGADKALLYDAVSDTGVDTKQVLSRYDAAGTLAVAIAFPVGSLFAGSTIVAYPMSLPVTFLLTALTSVIATICMWSVTEPPRESDIDENMLRSGWKGLQTIYHTPALRAFALNSSFIAATTFFIFWLYQPLAGSAGLPISVYGFIGAGFNLFAVVLLMNVKKLEKWVGMKNLLLLTAALPGVLFLLMVFQKSTIIILLGIFLVAGSKLLRAPILVDYMNAHIRSANRATVLSGVSMIEKISTFILYPVVGFLMDVSLDYALIALGVVTLLLAFVTRIEASTLNAKIAVKQ